MKIIIFDGTFKTTTFINRLAEGLAAKHHIYILGFNEAVHNKLKNVTYIGLGSNSSKILFVKRSVQLRGWNLVKQFQLLISLLIGKKKIIINQNIQLAIDKIQPDILHFQWVSVLSYLNKLKLPEQTKTIFSQRGYHINVRPFVDIENKKFLQSVFPKIDGFHSVSNAIKEVSNQIYNDASKIDEVVYSGFEYNDMPVKESNVFSESIQIISVGRNHWKKDYRTAINAMAILKKKNIKFQFTIIGVKKDEELLFLVSALKLQNHISFVYNLPQKEVYEKMIQSDLFLLPSVEEGIANVCIEAMFCKLPVLTTNCGGMEELVEDKVTGFIVPIRSPEKIALKIEDIVNLDVNHLRDIVKEAREKVIKQHGTSKMILDMENLYKKVYEAN